MDKFHMLSGEELVIQGAKKASVSLPELGLKEVFPNGSWLEQKQIQNALEARKLLVEVERIEKCGALSHALWREELQLAEVTQKCGGHWQYLGHNVGKDLFIKPEEALFLMEMNCLLLKFNDVTVSIQQAYSLLLRGRVSLVQYKVYASLSRLGYKLFRHEDCEKSITGNIEAVNTGKDLIPELASELINTPGPIYSQDDTVREKDKSVDRDKDEHGVITVKEKENELKEVKSDVIEIDDKKHKNVDRDKDEDPDIIVKDKEVELKEKEIVTMEIDDENQTIEVSASEYLSDEASKKAEVELKEKEIITMEIDDKNQTIEVSASEDLSDEASKKTKEDLSAVSAEICNKSSVVFIQNKLEMLQSRKVKPCNSDVVYHSFNENLPDLYQRHIVTIKAPEEQHIPRNVFLNNTAYVLNVENLRLKNVISSPSSSSQTYNSSDDVNGRHVGRIRSSLSNESAQSNWQPQFYPSMRFPQQTNAFRQFNYWSNFHFNLAFQRPFFPSMPLRFQVFPRVPQMYRCFPSPTMVTQSVGNTDPGRPRKRKRDNTKKYHVEAIKKLASKLKNLVASGNRQVENIRALQRLIETYNTRYKAKLQLTEELEIVENEIILETIELDADERSSPKKKRNDVESNLFQENFEALRKLALRLKELENKNESSPRHRRAFSNAVRTFNKSYNADIYVDSNYEVHNRRHIVIASSSDSEECAVEETPKPKKGKKLRNPFYIMKQLSEKQNATKSQDDSVEESSHNSSDSIPKKDFKYSEILTSNFDKSWLPSEDDFGRAEVTQKNQVTHRLMDQSRDFLYEFMRGHSLNNWVEAKIAYWQSCKESAIEFETNAQSQSNSRLNSIISPDDCTDIKSVLKKLSIIKTNKDVKDACSLRIDFDVYNRDVQNFKKTSKPKPHFRVICIEENSEFPNGVEFATHHSKRCDDVGIVFAIVGVASITYLQVNTTDLPVYIPTGNFP